MKVRPYQQCTRCVMDTTDPEIRFDEKGICNHCTGFLERLQEVKTLMKFGQEHLPAIIQKMKDAGKNKKYDALLGVSGGVDSSYVAYLLKQYGVRTLLVHMDNGWNSEDANLNIKNVVKRLGFDYESYVLNWDEFRDIQLAFLKASVVEAETPTDIAIQGALHRTAAKYGIKYIISGGNLATEGILPKMWHYNQKDTTYFKFIHQKFGQKKARYFPNFGYQAELYYKFIKGIKIIYLLNYVAFNKAQATKLLETELGWKNYGGKHHESRFTKFVQSYLLPKKFDLDYRKATLSSQICSGEITRQQALEALKAPIYNEEVVEREKEFIAKKLGISKAELNEIIDRPGKYYYEYPNDEKKLNFIYNVYRRFFA